MNLAAILGIVLGVVPALIPPPASAQPQCCCAPPVSRQVMMPNQWTPTTFKNRWYQGSKFRHH